MVRVSCELEADPEEVTFKWKTRNSKGVISSASYSASPFGGGTIDDETNNVFMMGRHPPHDYHGSVVSNGTRSWLIVVPQTEEDYGTVICWGRNYVGLQKEPCVFTLIPAGPPGPLHNCTVVKATEDSLTIKCLEGYDGGTEHGQRFHMEVHDSANQNRVLIANVTNVGVNADAVLTAIGLSPSTAYVCTVYAANERGTSQPTILVASTIPRPLSLSKSSKDNYYSFLLDYFDGTEHSDGRQKPSFLAILAIVTAFVTVLSVFALIVLLTLKMLRSGHLAKRHVRHGNGGCRKSGEENL